jgi:hypothetical protein
MNSVNEEIPYMAHATPHTRTVPVTDNFTAMVTGRPESAFEGQMYLEGHSPLVGKMSLATIAGLEQPGERAFGRVHICDIGAVMATLTAEVHPIEVDIRLTNPFLGANGIALALNLPPTPAPPVAQRTTVNNYAEVDDLLRILREASRTTGGKETKKKNKKQSRKRGGGNKDVIVECLRCNFVELEHLKLVVM